VIRNWLLILKVCFSYYFGSLRLSELAEKGGKEKKGRGKEGRDGKARVEKRKGGRG